MLSKTPQPRRCHQRASPRVLHGPRRYNQFAFNTLARVSPVSHGVCNVVKRVCIIGSSVMFFGNKLTDQTKLGTVIALVGTYLYTEATKKYGKHGAALPEESKTEAGIV